MSEGVMTDVDNFESQKLATRPFFVADVLAKTRDNFSRIDQLEGMRSIDSSSVFEGLSTALGWDPTNLPALRLLAWKQIRAAEWAKAKETLRAIIASWPALPDVRRELMRVNVLSPGIDGEEIFALAEKELHSALEKSSYTCQHLLATSRTITQALSRELGLAIDHYAAEMFRASANPPFAASSGNSLPFVEALKKLVAADRIALVGNGPILNGSKLGREIDDHDLVIRCNFPMLLNFQEDVGRKVDMMFFNESIIPKLADFVARDQAYSTCVCLAFHPEPSPIFPHETYLANMIQTVALVPKSVREFYRGFFYSRPTTGMMGIILLSVILRKDIDIYGFDFYSKGVNFFPTTSPIFLGHELQYERWFLEAFLAWIGRGKVTPAGNLAG